MQIEKRPSDAPTRLERIAIDALREAEESRMKREQLIQRLIESGIHRYQAEDIINRMVNSFGWLAQENGHIVTTPKTPE